MYYPQFPLYKLKYDKLSTVQSFLLPGVSSPVLKGHYGKNILDLWVRVNFDQRSILTTFS